jgi:hypothetical protein
VSDTRKGSQPPSSTAISGVHPVVPPAGVNPVHPTLGRPVRYKCEVAARAELDGQKTTATILDISRTGVFVETQLDLQVSDTFKLGLALPGGEPFYVEVIVVRLGASLREIRNNRVDNLTVLRRGVGVRFQHMNAGDLSRLDGFLELLDER